MPSYLDRAAGICPVLGPLMRGHARLYRATNGRIGELPGLPSLLLLDHVGARSGTRRTTPLIYMDDGDDLIVVPSKGATRAIPAGSTTCAPTRRRRSRSARSGSG